MKNEKPILMSAPMVRALLDGSKTQTRRIVKHQPIHVPAAYASDSWTWVGHHTNFDALRKLMEAENPFGQPGDTLWVKETHARVHEGLLQHLDPEPDKGTAFNNGWSTVYRADGEPANWKHYGQHWKPSIFCRREYSRITLEIVSVRVERLQDIGKDGRKAHDVLAEGITEQQIEQWRKWLHPDDAPAHTYGVLWESINGKGSWAANPWVWVIEFKKL